MKLPIPIDPKMLEQYAAWAIEGHRQGSGVELRYDDDSVSRLDRWINDHRHEITPEGIEYMGAVFGAFLGECMRRELGGVWEQQGDDWAVRLPLRNFGGLPGSTLCFPLIWTRSQLCEGESESIAIKFQCVSSMCKPEPGDDEPVAPAKSEPDPNEKVPDRILRLREFLGGGTPEDQCPDRALAQLGRVREAVVRARMNRNGTEN